MGLISVFLGFVLLLLGSYLASRRLFRLDPGSDAWVATVILAWFWVCFIILVLGHLGGLFRTPLLIATALPVGFGLLKRGGTDSQAGPVDTTESRTIGFWACLAIGLTAWACLEFFGRSFFEPVKVESDGPIYHLYFAARWWQSGRIQLIPTPFGETAAPYFPANGDLWLTWLFVLDGGDQFAKVGQAPFLAATAYVLMALGRRTGLSRDASIIATCWYVTLSPVIFFAFEANVDLLFVFGYVAAVYFFLRFEAEPTRLVHLAMGGLAAGAAWGTKAPGIVFIPPLLLFMLYRIVRRKGGDTTRGRAILTVLATPIMMEGYWLARNTLLTGNPFYPLHMKLGEFVILRGWFSTEVMPSSVYYIPFRDVRSFVQLILIVLDPREAWIWLVAICGVWAYRKKADQGQARSIWPLSFLAVLNVAIYWCLIPYRTEQRFFFHGLALATIPLAALFDRGRVIRVIAVILLGFHLFTPESWMIREVFGSIPWVLSPRIPPDSPELLPLLRDVQLLGTNPTQSRRLKGIIDLGIGTGCLLLAGAVGMALRGRGWKRRLVPIGILGGLILAKSTQKSGMIFPPFRDYYASWIDLQMRIGPKGARIAYSGTNLPYYLMGPDFRNRVFAIRVDDHPDWLLHDDHREARALGLPVVWDDTRPNWDRARPHLLSWLQNLKSEQIDFLVVARANPREGRLTPYDSDGFPIERAWAESRPDLFRRISDEPLMKIYGVIRPR